MRPFSFLLALVVAQLGIAAVADAVPVKAAAAGPPAINAVDPETTMSSPDGEHRYAAIPDGNRTRLLRIAIEGGEIADIATIPGDWALPAVAIDGTPGGLAHDGGTLVLIDPGITFPRRETSFLIVDPSHMDPVDEVTLRGDFSFDALSPDGRILYVVEYLSRDYRAYAIRKYDLERGRLLREPVLVAHEVAPGEMRGLPMTRVTSSDGLWEYTLYDGGGRRNDTAFIHTLDTERGISHCVDLQMVHGDQAPRIDLTLSGDDGSLSVIRGDETVATLNTETFALTETPPTTEAATSDGGGVNVIGIGALAAGAAIAIVAAFGLRRRRQGSALPVDPFGPGEPEPDAARAEERDRVTH